MSASIAMPACAFGTLEGGNLNPEATFQAVQRALQVGYRHFDCAEMYASTEAVGRALAEASATIPRNQLWITSKLKGLPCGEYTTIKDRLAAHIAQLGVECVDLLLCHWPGEATLDLGGDPEELLPQPTAWQYFTRSVAEAWANMTRLQQDGLAVHIGVSNFSTACLSELLALPGGAQVYAHQLYADLAHPPARELVQLHQEHRIKAMAYRPISFIPAWPLAVPEVEATLDTAAAALGAKDMHQMGQVALFLQGTVDALVTSSVQEDHLGSNFAAKQVAERIASLDDPACAVVLAAVEKAVSQLQANLEVVEVYGGVDPWGVAFMCLGPEPL
uniref:NADP-dependent oxidoreductase domain-containing protein n=1 Tax=Eutreptiella gymnastica TaxID=73025 RepID=A0A7S1IW92_9EUGL